MASKKATSLSTDPYKGVRDFYPEEQAELNYILSVWRSVCEKFGYQEYHASILEPTELYHGKTSEEIVNEQTYNFKDRGDRDVTLRPEMTPSVARMVAAKRKELQFPLRWYSIPNVFRYERPQRGRLREHWQLNADLFGVSNLEAEVEIVSLAYSLMLQFGAEVDTFAIKVNSRRAVNELFASYNLSPVQQKQLRLLIDKKDKLKDFEAQVEALVGSPFSFPTTAPKDVVEIISKLKAIGIENVLYDSSLMRGFDYYTGIVFEVFDTDPQNPRSLFGGGRYDELLSIFGVDPVPTVGIAMGDVTARDFLETHNLLPEPSSKTKLFLATLSSEFVPDAQRLGATLRLKGLTVAVNLTDRKIGDQLKYADKLRIPHVIVIGADEVGSGSYKLKELKTGAEKTVTSEGIIEALA